jgi:peroxiredoxin
MPDQDSPRAHENEVIMSLKQELAEYRAGWFKRVPAERQAIMERHIAELRNGLAKTALKVGDRAPAIVLGNARGETVDVRAMLKKGPVIVAFYRGGWCPYCNLELRAFQRVLPDIEAAGASLVAISPEKPDDTPSTAEKNALTFEVLRDVGQKVGRAFRLVPQGSKLVGLYDSQISFGQDRVLLVWTRLIMPNGRSIVLERQPGADTQGFAGLEDEVDQHWGRLLMAAALSTVLGVGAELGATNNDSAIVTALRRGSTDSLNQTGQQIVRRNLNIQPTVTIRPGFPVRVIVNRDLVLTPYQS